MHVLRGRTSTSVTYKCHLRHILCLRVNSYIETPGTHEARATASAELASALSIDYALPADLKMPLQVVETMSREVAVANL